jgi:hypothetical protein
MLRKIQKWLQSNKQQYKYKIQKNKLGEYRVTCYLGLDFWYMLQTCSSLEEANKIIEEHKNKLELLKLKASWETIDYI